MYFHILWNTLFDYLFDMLFIVFSSQYYLFQQKFSSVSITIYSFCFKMCLFLSKKRFFYIRFFLPFMILSIHIFKISLIFNLIKQITITLIWRIFVDSVVHHTFDFTVHTCHKKLLKWINQYWLMKKKLTQLPTAWI